LLSQGIRAQGAGTPVWAQPVPAGAAVTGVDVWVLSHRAALAAGVQGVVFTARAAAGSGVAGGSGGPGGAGGASGAAGGPVRLGISYAGFGEALGGNYGFSLGLAELPVCALPAPQRPACRTEQPVA